MTGPEQRLKRWIPSGAPELRSGQIHLWLVPLDPETADFDAMDEILSAEERDRAARFKVAGGRERYTMGRGFMRMLLGHYLDRDPAGLHFVYNNFGKPALAGGAVSSVPRPLGFNLSHSAGLGLCAFTREGDLGVDIEKYREEVLAEKLAGRFFSPEEAEELARLAPAEQLPGFFRCWTRKEAYIKARGDGLSRSLSSFAVSLSPQDPPLLRWCHDDPSASTRWRVWDATVPSGYAGCVVAPAAADRLQQWDLRPMVKMPLC